MKKTVDTIIQPRWIVPIEPHNTYLENHALIIRAGRIENILPQTAVAETYTAKETINLPEHVVLPGLINTHTHSPMTLFRGMADDLSLHDWLQNHIWPAEKKWLSSEFCYDGTLLAILEMLRSGTTCFNENFFYAESIAQVAADMGMRAAIGGFVIDFPSSYAKSLSEYLEKAEQLYAQWHNHPLITTSICPHAPYSVSDASFLEVKKLAEKYQLKIHLHLHETEYEIQESIKTYNKRPIQRMYDLGVLTSNTQCIHMTAITKDDIALLQKTGAHIVHCPESNLKLASGFAPIYQFQQANINVAIGTDGPASNNDLDMFAEMQTAALVGKAVAQNPSALDAATCLRMATLNGAVAMGLNDHIGSLVPGKAADIIAVDLADLNTQPIYNPISHLVYAVNSRQVSDVWIAGKRLLENFQFANADKNAILNTARKWQEKIRK